MSHGTQEVLYLLLLVYHKGYNSRTAKLKRYWVCQKVNLGFFGNILWKNIGQSKVCRGVCVCLGSPMLSLGAPLSQYLMNVTNPEALQTPSSGGFMEVSS